MANPSPVFDIKCKISSSPGTVVVEVWMGCHDTVPSPSLLK